MPATKAYSRMETIAASMGRHRETVGKGLRVLHDAGMISLAYLSAKERERKIIYGQGATGMKPRLVDGLSSSRIRGVRITLCTNRKSERVRNNLGRGLVDTVVYERPRGGINSAAATTLKI